jgi:hypothetical protein
MPTRIGGTTVFGPGTTLPTRPGGPSTPTVPTPVAPAPVRPGWGPPTTSPWMKPAYDIVIPDNLGRPPRTTDVTIKRGFDNRTPDEVVSLVKRNLKGGILQSNRAFVDRTIKENHRSFTIAVSNMFIAGSPPNRFIANLAMRNSVSVQMTMSSVNPVIISALAPGASTPRYFAKGPNGDYAEIPAHKYPVVAESRIRLKPEPGLTMEYPLWAHPPLKGVITTIEEL